LVNRPKEGPAHAERVVAFSEQELA
jgi:hypothetical protein